MANKGNYYKLRTKKWLKEKGYEVSTMERMQRIVNEKNGEVLFIKKDQLGSDLLATNSEQIIFIQVKLNRNNVAEGVKELAKQKLPSFCERWVVIWEPRAREPEIIEVEGHATAVGFSE